MRNRTAVLVLMCSGMFLVLLDVTVVNVALPAIGADLGAGVRDRQWVVDGYAVAIASGLLVGGACGERFGQRRLVLIGLCVFGIASLGCGVATDTSTLIGSRVVQGLGAALLLPCSMAVITEAYPGRAEQARALGVWAGVSSLALPAGPLLGGFLVDSVGWRWVFLINVPIVALTVLGTVLLVPRSGASAARRLDVSGVLTLAVGLAAAVFAVINGGSWVAVLIAVAALAAFLLAQRRASDPVLPGWLLHCSPFRAATTVSFLMNLTCNGTLFVLTLYLQSVLGYGATEAGLFLLPLFLPLAVLGPVTGRLTARYGPRLPVCCGAVLAGAGHLALLGVGDGSVLTLIPAMLGIGIGLGLVTAAAVAAAVAAVPADRAGVAAGVNNTARQTGTAIGVAVFGAVAGRTAQHAQFVFGMHVVGVVAALLWVVAGFAGLACGGVRQANRTR